jgi:hypothetical protein
MLLAAAFLLPSSALATSQCSNANSDPTEAQYCGPAGIHEGGTNHHGAQGVKGAQESSSGTPSTGTPTTVEAVPTTVEAEAVQETSSSNSLPFTGLDVGVLAIVALALGATGLLLRRLTGPRDARS